MKPLLVGLGSPFLDALIPISDEFLIKYHLRSGNAVLADERHSQLFEDGELEKAKIDNIPGGSPHNTIRAAQWMLQVPYLTSFIGSIGDDNHGTTLRRLVEKEGVITHYIVQPEQQTGKCAVLIPPNKDRSLVAYLGASKIFELGYLDQEEIRSTLHSSQYLFTSGFFLNISFESVLFLAQHSAQNNKVFLFNLGSPFFINTYWKEMAQILQYADILFCNRTEAQEVAKKLSLQNQNDMEGLALTLASLPIANDKDSKVSSRIVVFTQGSEDTIVCYKGQVEKYSPMPCPLEEIVDLNGAGDSFIGGFIAGLIKTNFSQSRHEFESNLATCLKYAHYCAWECIRHSGCTFPEKPKGVLFEQSAV